MYIASDNIMEPLTRLVNSYSFLVIFFNFQIYKRVHMYLMETCLEKISLEDVLATRFCKKSAVI